MGDNSKFGDFFITGGLEFSISEYLGFTNREIELMVLENGVSHVLEGNNLVLEQNIGMESFYNSRSGLSDSSLKPLLIEPLRI